MRGAVTGFFLLAAWFASAATASAPGSGVFQQWPGYYGDWRTPHATVALTQLQWERLWSSVRKEPPRNLNLATEMGVIVHIGERPTGGYAVEVVRTYVENDRFVVEFTEIRPPPHSGTTQALTQPWVIAIVPRSELRVAFREK